MFEDTFYSVRKNLKDVFSRFFGAGSADIKLTDPDDPLRSGVELSFNPPGKKISNKNLLSGGEKAIAALVLLFALFLRKPTPFCFLDEVDAPLDDENAKKFINMIKQVAEGTQFAIITHKHLTMSYADCLYGVTMQEGGVSTLLSVELKN
jgi:chromosome segregation protein